MCAAVCCVFLQKPRCQLPLELKEGRTNRAGMLTGCTPAGKGAQSRAAPSATETGKRAPESEGTLGEGVNVRERKAVEEEVEEEVVQPWRVRSNSLLSFTNV